MSTEAPHSYYMMGWEAAQRDYPNEPKERSVVRSPVAGDTEQRREWFVEGYQAWCTGRYAHCRLKTRG